VAASGQPEAASICFPECPRELPGTHSLPLRIVYGGRGFLVAHADELPEMRLWRLDRIVSIDLLDRGFARREDFDLSAYAAQSFGVFQEEPINAAV
jgi:predicted DNA-binding transcriptional regulator YafY